MKRVKYLGFIVIVALSLCITNSCRKDSSGLSKVDLEINQFIWGGLNYYYLWKDSVPRLNESYFQNDQKKLDNFLNTYSDHEKLFNDLLYPNRDKWSWIVDDYTTLENELQGITKTMGFEFGLVRYSSSSSNVFGYVRYVFPNSPASKGGLKRGDIFSSIDDQQITTSNYQTLLFNKDSYKLSFSNISGTSITLNGKQVTLTAVELQENPVFLDTVYTINSYKIGYLVYNGFYPDFDNALNNVFAKFKVSNIQYLILDLRYNGGGSIQSAINLASMIYSPDHTKIFDKRKYNVQVQFDLTNTYGSKFFNDYLTDTIARTSATGGPTTINTVGVNKLYVLTTGSTASASELVINGLKPYITVTTIGTNSVGKYVGSITVKDIIDSKGTVNPNNKWAMQPIVLKLANANNESDYVNGFTPKVTVNEINYLSALLPLGDVNEPLLKAALNDLQGLPQQISMVKSGLGYQNVADSKDFRPHAKEMYLNSSAPFIPHNKLKNN